MSKWIIKFKNQVLHSELYVDIPPSYIRNIRIFHIMLLRLVYVWLYCTYSKTLGANCPHSRMRRTDPCSNRSKDDINISEWVFTLIVSSWESWDDDKKFNRANGDWKRKKEKVRIEWKIWLKERCCIRISSFPLVSFAKENCDNGDFLCMFLYTSSQLAFNRQSQFQTILT
jgi:hypothetical protein